MPDSFLRSDFMYASLTALEVLFCGTGEDSLVAAEVRAMALIGMGGAARLLKLVLLLATAAASDVG